VAFRPVVGKHLVDCVNYSFEFGELSNSQKQAIATLIEQKGKDKKLPLINADTKIISKVLANRLENVWPSLIQPNQNAFVKGRSIFYAFRPIDDIVDYSQRNGWSGILVAIDFEKAFDILNFNFLTTVELCINLILAHLLFSGYVFFANIQLCNEQWFYDRFFLIR